MKGFRVGDRVLIKSGTGSKLANSNIGKIAKIKGISLYHSGADIVDETFVDVNLIHHLIVDIGYGGIWPDEASLVKHEPKTEVEFLDCFQLNFKEGV